ncbi:MarR family winged helix-turn-helix transcriptional regulator [Paenibacillus sp. SGZ-1009]|uniref:MarR family winged helix-turn-helix transcriptional regulator n=1 Tax=Paenibacillus campi TaxID=3106031 RepID=UPI002AFF8979|nr:MarR family transcriptional regulator [Paenibacillus sp. SGZ-1009]
MQKDSIGKLISYINRLNQKQLARSFKPYGIGSGGHHSYLKAILQRPGVNQDQLTNDLKFDKATTARSVRQLEEEGYIERHVDPNDRRAYLLYPTERAQAFEPILYQTLQEANERLTSSLSVEEKEQLWQLLNKIYHSNNE